MATLDVNIRILFYPWNEKDTIQNQQTAKWKQKDTFLKNHLSHGLLAKLLVFRLGLVVGCQVSECNERRKDMEMERRFLPFYFSFSTVLASFCILICTIKWVVIPHIWKNLCSNLHIQIDKVNRAYAGATVRNAFDDSFYLYFFSSLLQSTCNIFVNIDMKLKSVVVSKYSDANENWLYID